jgi:hypothetical protein
VTPALHPFGYGRIGAIRPDDAQPPQSPRTFSARVWPHRDPARRRGAPPKPRSAPAYRRAGAAFGPRFFPPSYPRRRPASVVLTD